jgi:tRNA G18 (ribose-2'-O)-methylase SpoU
MTHPVFTLIGDGIENPWNARTLRAAAAMFGGQCCFRDRKDLAAAFGASAPAEEPLRTLELDELAAMYAPIIALDNVEGAAEIFGFRTPADARPAVVVGNERRGIAADVRGVATHRVEIPMAGRGLDTLNVAAAAAVALYYLSRGGGPVRPTRAASEARRPELLLIGGRDHVELGSTIRSAGAFGWSRLLVDDRGRVWFGCDRAVRAEGRAAARRARNPIRLLSANSDERFAFSEVTVVTAQPRGTPLHRAALATGPRRLVVLPDETTFDLEVEDWQRLGRHVEFVHLDLPVRDFPYHLRLSATIVLAEIARQIGRPAPGAGRRRPRLRSEIEVLAGSGSELIHLEDLDDY